MPGTTDLNGIKLVPHKAKEKKVEAESPIHVVYSIDDDKEAKAFHKLGAQRIDGLKNAFMIVGDKADEILDGFTGTVSRMKMTEKEIKAAIDDEKKALGAFTKGQVKSVLRYITTT